MKRCMKCGARVEGLAEDHKYCSMCGGILVLPEVYEQIQHPQQLKESPSASEPVQMQPVVNVDIASGIARCLSLIAELGLVISVFLPIYRFELFGINLKANLTLWNTLNTSAIALIIIAVISFFFTLCPHLLNKGQILCGFGAIALVLISLNDIYENIAYNIPELISESFVQSLAQLGSGGITMIVCSGLILLSSFLIWD